MPRTIVRVAGAVLALALLAAACGGGGDTAASDTPSTDESTPASGGTLRLALVSDVQQAFDPQQEYYGVAWEYDRCCLLRTLVSYNGKTTDEEGAELFPDLAAQMPEISADGLTWTFALQQGLHYAPPLEDVEITAGDFVRAMERTADPRANVGGYSFYYSVIEGFDEFAEGKADSISGIEAVDDHTLDITLIEPTGDLGYRMAMPSAAPIPPNPFDEKARLGVAEGHDPNYGRYMVASGPYMFEGSEQLDFSVPAAQQDPVAGYQPGRSLVLVRNPSWDPATDQLRPAYPDRIETAIGGNSEDLALQVESDEIDLVLDGVPPSDQVQRYSTDPQLSDRLHANPSDAVRYMEMNLANPPFDDVHVRRALNYAMDKEGLRQLRGGPLFGELAGHIMVDSLQNNLLVDFDPYATDNGSGDLEAAKAEMAQSKYDSDGDGVCDDPVCQDLLTFSDAAAPYPKQLALTQQTLEPLGITLDPKALERTTMYAKCEDPNTGWQLCTSTSWGKDYADGFTFGPPLFSQSAIGPESCCNDPMVGVTEEMLGDRGYDRVAVPSAEEQIQSCVPLTAEERFQCWADLDRYLMEDVVPWVPYLFDNNVVILSSRVSNWSFDQFAGLPALDHLAVTGS
ncbi:MAG: ABC transporter substrate-binding protein [Actinomycetota bacterium]